MLLFDKIAKVIRIIKKTLNENNFLLPKDDKYHCEFEKEEDKLE
jgi:hypothetical protein